MENLSLLDHLAHGNLIEDCRKRDVIATCWLVTSDKIRNDGKKAVLDMFNKGMLERGLLSNPLTEENFDATVIGILPQVKLVWENWIASERAFEEERKKGNPRAFFIA